MAWVKVDDQFFRHPKVLAAGRDARDLYLVGLCYCAQALTDGFIPSAAVRVLAAEAEIETATQSAGRLVAVTLWEEAEGGYRMTNAIRWEYGHDPQDQEIRNTVAYRQWRAAVLSRDGYSCRRCGATDVPLHAHHVKAFSQYPELRLVVSNGITLCVPCHGETHGRRLA